MKMSNGAVSTIDPVASSGSSRQLFWTGCCCRLARPLDSPTSGHMAENHLAWDQVASWSTAWRRQSRAPRRRLPRWGRSPSRWRRPGSASPTLEALSSGRTGWPTSSICLYFDLKFCFHLRFGIYAQFEHDGHTEIGVLFPGKSFINSTLLLGDSVKTDQVWTWLAFQKKHSILWRKKFLQELSLLFPPGMSVCMDLVSQVVIMLVGLSWPSSSSPRCHAWCPSQEVAWVWGLNLSLGWRKSLSRRPPPLPRRKERRRNVDGWVWPYCVEQSRNIVRIGLLLFSDVFRQKSKLTCFSWTWNCNICRIPIHLLVVLSLFLLFSYHLFWCIGAYS